MAALEVVQALLGQWPEVLDALNRCHHQAVRERAFTIVWLCAAGAGFLHVPFAGR